MRTGDTAVAVLVPVLTAFVTAVVGTLGLLFQDRVNRSDVGRRKLLLEEATQRVTFTAEWWKARQAIDSTPEELNQAAARALAWLNEASELIHKDEEPRVSLRRLLLLKRFERRTAKILRVGYYLFLIVMLIASVATTGSAAQGAIAENNAWNFAYTVLFGVVALALRFFAVVAEDAQPPRQGT
jgi:hypothetical protein